MSDIDMIPTKFPALTIIVMPGLICIHGRETAVEVHRHHALQVSIALDEKYQFECDGWSGWCEGVIVAADVPHRMEGSHGGELTLLIDPEHAHAKYLAARHLGEREFAELSPALVARIRDRLLADLENDQNLPLEIEKLLDILVPESITIPSSDERIRKTAEHLVANPGRRVSASELTRRAGLSESRLAHLFRQEIGIPIRRYGVWVRLIHAVKLAATGMPLADAAQAAAFSDSAHLARTFRAMFGIQPSLILKNSRIVQAYPSNDS